MLTAMQHMDSSAYASSPSASPWQQLLTAQRGHLLPYDYEGLTSVPAAAHAPAAHQQHRPARRVARRRPRPSRRLPTTYISADPAEFRRMVHQVTGADELLLPPVQQQAEGPLLPKLAARAAPSSAGGALLLPTLDTSSFLLGGCRARPSTARTGAMPAPTTPDGSLPLDSTSGGSSSCGFPTLESWDLL
ncbi:calmodulin-binding protein 25-like [Triticum urartu]|uniref:VQ domain-containing protein n=2 Tax=Triticum TaxID=4564 RepID=A0A9R0TP07_TRITD|nr:calmodulin-binding protein 25-like [Triticum dicoccoides]XP_044384826.1 calmodulin-binding protein 25-like [Triticum aestivum]XP_048574666.1 calmodulin-binding protein 25-like [Triticum urartu]XP_048574700.1 calmodulin-binding protein 25-like [Triticum urartu]VAI15864.1 unnamed protein product [Triticum turgidum subsp. durum]